MKEKNKMKTKEEIEKMMLKCRHIELQLLCDEINGWIIVVVENASNSEQ